jgi:hypothetical protein
MVRQRRGVIAKAKLELETGKTTPSPSGAEFRPRGDGSPPPIHMSADVGLPGLSVPFLAEVSGAVEIHLGKVQQPLKE